MPDDETNIASRFRTLRTGMMFHAVTRRAIGAGILLLTLVFAILAGAEIAMIPTSNGYCDLKFPKWLGCVVANHENLAGGLIGAAGTLFAGWLAWTAVQTQMSDARERAQADRSEVEELLSFDVDNIAEALGAIWKVLDAIDDEQTLETNETRLLAVKTGLSFVTENSWIETAKSKIEVLGWNRRRLYSGLLNSLIELQAYEKITVDEVYGQITNAVAQAAGACELLFPNCSEYFEGRFRRSPKAYSWGYAVLMYADLLDDEEQELHQI
jgi:hypothetical protein